MIEQTQDAELLATFFGRDAGRYVYQLGDLDPFFFPATRWWVTRPGNITSALLLYTAFETPIIQAITDNDEQGRLWEALLPELPDRAHVHYLRRHEPIFGQRYRIEHQGPHRKMQWNRRRTSSLALRSSHGHVRVLNPEDRPRIRELYRAAYPDAHFDERTLDLGRVTGSFIGEQLVAIAACHVYSRKHSVAAIGAVATHPEFRGRGHCRAVTGKLVELLSNDVETIGLNVHRDNTAAIHVYESLGFEHILDYEEAMIERA